MEPKTYYVRGVPSHMVGHFWKFAEPFIKRALDHTFGEVGIDDIQKGCMERDIQLWLISSPDKVVGAATTEIVQYPKKLVCRVITLAGAEFDEWRRQCLMLLKDWATEQGCDGIEVYVRRGFVPKLVEIGFKHKYSVCHLSLKD